jgi:hypothetical protein
MSLLLGTGLRSTKKIGRGEFGETVLNIKDVCDGVSELFDF